MTKGIHWTMTRRTRPRCRFAAALAAAVLVSVVSVPRPAAQETPAAEAEKPAPPDLAAVRAAIARGEAEDVSLRLWNLARGGDVEAQRLLGDLHMRGEGVPKNYSMAGNWYRAAADQGDAEARFKLAELYREGKGVPLYREKAVALLTEAARQGHDGARRRLRELGIEPPPVKPMEPPRGSDESGPGKTETDTEKAAEAAMEKAAGMVAEEMEKAETELAGLIAEAANGNAQTRLDIGLAGHGPPGEGALDPALNDLIGRYAAAVNAGDVEMLKPLMGPEYAACRTDENQAAYDAYLADGLGFSLPPGWTARLGELNADAPLPFGDLVTYPVRPGHYVLIDLAGEPRAEPGDGLALPATVIQPVAEQDGAWSLVFGCPTPEGIARLRRAGLVGAGG